MCFGPWLAFSCATNAGGVTQHLSHSWCSGGPSSFVCSNVATGHETEWQCVTMSLGPLPSSLHEQPCDAALEYLSTVVSVSNGRFERSRRKAAQRFRVCRSPWPTPPRGLDGSSCSRSSPVDVSHSTEGNESS